MKRREKILAVVYGAVLDIASLAFILATLLAMALWTAMASSNVWPGSPEMANLVKADEWTLFISLMILIAWPRIGPVGKISNEEAASE